MTAAPSPTRPWWLRSASGHEHVDKPLVLLAIRSLRRLALAALESSLAEPPSAAPASASAGAADIGRRALETIRQQLAELGRPATVTRFASGEVRALTPWLVPTRWRPERRRRLIVEALRPFRLSRPEAGGFSDTDVLLFEIGRERGWLDGIAGWWRVLPGGPVGLDTGLPLIEALAFEEAGFRMVTATRLRSHLAQRVLFFPERPPATPFSSAIWLPIIWATLAEPHILRPAARRLTWRLGEAAATRLDHSSFGPWDEWLLIEATRRATAVRQRTLGSRIAAMPLIEHPDYADLRLKLAAADGESASGARGPGTARSPATPLPGLLSALIERRL